MFKSMGAVANTYDQKMIIKIVAMDDPILFLAKDLFRIIEHLALDILKFWRQLDLVFTLGELQRLLTDQLRKLLDLRSG